MTATNEQITAAIDYLVRHEGRYKLIATRLAEAEAERDALRSVILTQKEQLEHQDHQLEQFNAAFQTQKAGLQDVIDHVERKLLEANMKLVKLAQAA